MSNIACSIKGAPFYIALPTGHRGSAHIRSALVVFLKHLIDASDTNGRAKTAWLSTAILPWREVASISDYGLQLDSGWSPAQKRHFIALAEDASARVAKRASLAADEIVGWHLLDDLRIFPRGATEVLTAPVAELGRAIIELVSGELPEEPDGQVWFYATPDGRHTLGRQSPG
jgi:hypothetical protein